MHPQATIHNVIQGTDEWHAARCGILTASEVKSIVTPTLKVAKNDKTRTAVYELAAQRITEYTEPTFYNDDMLRGHVDEVKSRDLYSEYYEPVEEMGFITRDIGGVTIGFSPDGVGVIGNFGIECKSRMQKYQLQIITDNEIPKEHLLQIHTGLLVTGWDYMDYVSYCGGLPMWVIRCEPDPVYQEAITEAAIDFEKQVQEKMYEYQERLAKAGVVIETEREQPETEVYFE